jgi:hypothetical protein
MQKALLAFLLASGSVTLTAQWINIAPAGVPKKPAGALNLNAPTPRAPDGHPDLSGMWLIEKNNPCPPDGCPDMEISREFVNIAWNMPGGLPLQPWAAALRKARMDAFAKDDPGSNCRPTGILKLTINPFYRKFVQLPGVLLILTERETVYRQIFTDGRALPVDPLPTPNGYSVGKWNGDTLEVLTTGITDGQWADRAGAPLTDAAKITQRFRRVNYGRMEIEIVVDDAKAYTKPWSVKVNQFISNDTELMDYYCMENERDIVHAVGK